MFAFNISDQRLLLVPEMEKDQLSFTGFHQDALRLTKKLDFSVKEGSSGFVRYKNVSPVIILDAVSE